MTLTKMAHLLNKLLNQIFLRYLGGGVLSKDLSYKLKEVGHFCYTEQTKR